MNPEQVFDLKSEINHACILCEKTFSTASNMKRHIKNVHHEPVNNLSIINEKKCPMCTTFTCRNADQLRKHLEMNHDVQFQIEEKVFTTESEFQEWRDKTEQETNSSFSKGSGGNFLLDGSKKVVYNCSRSGKYKAKGSGQRALKCQGSKKIDSDCPAKITATFATDNSIKVEFVKTHCGHQLGELKHLNLRDSEKLEIATKLKMGVTREKILDDIRNTICEPLVRKHLITKQDITNVKRDYKINDSTVRNINDFVSVQIWVKEMENLGTFNPVLLFKQQHEDSNLEGVGKEDFILVIMSMGQQYVLSEFSKNVVCLDSTHGTNGYDFELTTLLVIDDMGKGFPGAFMFSNKQNTDVYKIFFNIIKNKVGKRSPKVFMSDDTETFYNAWIHVMGEVPHRLLCSWHVIRSWTRKLKALVGGSDLQKETYKKLKTIQMELDQVTFLRSFNKFVETLKTDEATEKFADYLLLNYANRPNLWAYCYRNGLGINTNMRLERFHGILKYGKKVKRLDKSINAVLDYTRDVEFRRIITLQKGENCRKLTEIRKRHAKTLDMSDYTISRGEGDNVWEVFAPISNEGEITSYLVKVNDENCNCHLKCESCNKCIHNFSCTCSDYCIKWNMCKHIHLVLMTEIQLINEVEDATEEFDFIDEGNLEIIVNDDDDNNKENEISAHMSDLTKITHDQNTY